MTANEFLILASNNPLAADAQIAQLLNRQGDGVLYTSDNPHAFFTMWDALPRDAYTTWELCDLPTDEDAQREFVVTLTQYDCELWTTPDAPTCNLAVAAALAEARHHQADAQKGD